MPNSFGTYSPSGFITNFLNGNTNEIASIVTITTNFSQLPLETNGFLTPSAIEGTDYFTNDNQTLVFDDYQMSQDAFIYVEGSTENSPAGEGGPDYPDALSNNIVGGIPRRIIMTLINPRLDPLESLDIEPPTLAPNYLEVSGGTETITEILSTGDTETITETVSGGYASNMIGTNFVTQAALDILDIYNPPTNSPCNTTNGTFNGTIYNFERSTFRCDKDWDNVVTVYVIRTGDTSTNATVTLAVNTIGKSSPDNDWLTEAGSDYAVSGTASTNTNNPAPGNYDFVSPTNLTLNFAANSDNASLTISLNNSGAVEQNMDFLLSITGIKQAAGKAYVGNVSNAVVTILFDDDPGKQQPGGAADRSWNMDGLETSVPPYNFFPGANLEVDAMAIDTNGNAIIAGQFDSYDSQVYNHVARILPSGYPDGSFNPGSGANDSVLAVALDPAGRIIVGGNFTSFNNQPGTYHIARLNSDGSLDTSFNTGQGANGPVRSIALDRQGNILIGGDFNSFNNVMVSNVARLFPNGALDTAFNPGPMDPYGTVYAVAPDMFNRVVIGGSFSTVNGTNWVGLARLTSTGALDTTFNPGTDVPGGTVYCLAVNPQNNGIVFGGSFSQYNLYSYNNIAAANSDGSANTNFSPGTGANDIVNALVIQTNGNIVLGGQFTQVCGVRRIGFARLFTNGWLDTGFLDPYYNQFAGLINHYYNTAAVNLNDYPSQYNTPNFIKSMALQSDGNILIGGSFTRVGGGFTRDDARPRWNVARVIGAANAGPMTAGGGLGNYPGSVSFSQNHYSVDDKQTSLYITVQRVNGSLGPINVVMTTNNLPPGPGAAGPQDYQLLNNGAFTYEGGEKWIGIPYGWRVGDGDYGTTYFELAISNDLAAQQNLFAYLSMLSVSSADSFLLGGENMPTLPTIGMGSAQLEIINDNVQPGILGFGLTNYATVDSNTFVTISVIRTNGSTGSVFGGL